MRLAFGYKTGVGKRSCIRYLITKYGGTQLSFQTGIAGIVNYAQLQCNTPRVNDAQFVRQCMEWSRKHNETVWVDRMENQIDDWHRGNLYITDMNYKNEFDMLRRKNVLLIRIDSDRCAADNVHELDMVPIGDWDVVLRNTTDMDDLFGKLDTIVSKEADYTPQHSSDLFIPGVSSASYRNF